MIRLLILFTGIAVLLGTTGFLTTETVVPDYPSHFSGVNKVTAAKALKYAHFCIDNPIERLVIQKLSVASLKLEEPVAERAATQVKLGANKQEARSSLSIGPDGNGARALQPIYQARILAYTIFAIPVSTILVWGNETNFSSCSKI